MSNAQGTGSSLPGHPHFGGKNDGGGGGSYGGKQDNGGGGPGYGGKQDQGGGHGGSGGGGGGSTPPPPPGPPPRQSNAYTIVMGLLNQYGLGSLGKVVLGYVKQGYNTDAIKVLIQQTPEWKQRFAGNEIRLKNGLAPLDASTYLATEASYADALRAAGLPQGFYDGGQDFANWIGGDVSPTEVQDRANEVAHLVNSSDPDTLAALQHYYGIDKGHIAAYFLDQKRAMPILQQMEASANIGGAAIRQGLNLSADRADLFAKLGVNAQQAQQAYGQIGQALPGALKLSEIYHQGYGQQDLENELLGHDAGAALRRQKLNQTEEASFEGGGGAGSTLQDPGYGVARPTAGQF